MNLDVMDCVFTLRSLAVHRVYIDPTVIKVIYTDGRTEEYPVPEHLRR